MIEETACNEEAALIEGGLPGVTGTGVTAADVSSEMPAEMPADASTDVPADAPKTSVSRETLASEQGECMSRQRASLEVPVDMISIARTAQIEGAGLKLVAPAKVNLFLSIGDRRDNGYHDVSTVLHAVALHDVLYMKRADIVAARAALESAEEGAPNEYGERWPRVIFSFRLAVMHAGEWRPSTFPRVRTSCSRRLTCSLVRQISLTTTRLTFASRRTSRTRAVWAAALPTRRRRLSARHVCGAFPRTTL